MKLFFFFSLAHAFVNRFHIFIASYLHKVCVRFFFPLDLSLFSFTSHFHRKHFTEIHSLACVLVCLFLVICQYFIYQFLNREKERQRMEKRASRSRCCKQNQQLSSSSNSNFLINNSQTNHFISHFFFFLSLFRPVFCFARMFATFPLNASNFQ